MSARRTDSRIRRLRAKVRAQGHGGAAGGRLGPTPGARAHRAHRVHRRGQLWSAERPANKGVDGEMARWASVAWAVNRQLVYEDAAAQLVPLLLDGGASVRHAGTG